MLPKSHLTEGKQSLLALPTRIGCFLAAVTIFSGTALATDADAVRASSTDNPHAAIDSSVDFSSLRSGWFYTNLTVAPVTGLFESGFRFRVTAGTSWYSFINGEDPLTYGSGRSSGVAALVGYELVMQRISILGLVGPTFSQSTDDGVFRTQTGATAIVQFYARPTEQTMSSGQLTYSTNRNSFEMKAKIGLKIFDDPYFGPEVRVYEQDAFSRHSAISEKRIGLHVSSIRVGPVFLGLSGGFAFKPEMGWGNYGGISIYSSF